MFSARMRVIIAVAAVAVWYAAVRSSIAAADLLFGPQSQTASAGGAEMVYADSAVEAALARRSELESRRYEGGHGSPFMPTDAVKAPSASMASRRPWATSSAVVPALVTSYA